MLHLSKFHSSIGSDMMCNAFVKRMSFRPENRTRSKTLQGGKIQLYTVHLPKESRWVSDTGNYISIQIAKTNLLAKILETR